MSKVKIDKATIRAVAQPIADRFDPEQIILFGSHARGNAGSHSDTGLLIARKSLDDCPRRNIFLCAAMEEYVTLPVDVFVTAHDLLVEQLLITYPSGDTALETRGILCQPPATWTGLVREKAMKT